MNKLLLSFLSAAVLLASCGDTGETPQTSVPRPTADTTAPTVSLNAVQSGTTVNLTANVSDDVGVSKVEFYRAGALVSTDTVAPYTASDPISAANNGNVTYSAKAYDAAGNVGQGSQTIAVSVTPPTPPARTLYQGVWGWAIGTSGTGQMIDSGAVVFTRETTNAGLKAAAGLYVNEAQTNHQAGARAGVAVLGPLTAAGKLETAFSLNTTADNRLYFVGLDSDNTLELYEGKPRFAGPGALVTANNQPGPGIFVVLIQMSDTVPSSAQAQNTLKVDGKTLAAQALQATLEARAPATTKTNPRLFKAAQKSLSR